MQANPGAMTPSAPHNEEVEQEEEIVAEGEEMPIEGVEQVEEESIDEVKLADLPVRKVPGKVGRYGKAPEYKHGDEAEDEDEKEGPDEFDEVFFHGSGGLKCRRTEALPAAKTTRFASAGRSIVTEIRVAVCAASHCVVRLA